MKTVAVYNMKGGVGKTTAAVNLSYCAAAEGWRTLLWDLDPQAASTYAFRVRPRVSGFDRRAVEDAQAFGAAVKETDWPNLFLLPADFAYRKFERFLDALGKPERVMTGLIEAIGRDFDLVVLDCPAGFSLTIEGVFEAADAVLVPVIPTVLSLRTLARLVKWANRTDARTKLAAFLNMVDRRKALHRRASELVSTQPAIFMTPQIPYASIVEQMSLRRLPLAAFADREPAAVAFKAVWSEAQMLLKQKAAALGGGRDRWAPMLNTIDTLIEQLESATHTTDAFDEKPAAADGNDVVFVHRFDTERRDLERSGHVLELRESGGRLYLVATAAGEDASETNGARAQIDGSWARQILSGEMSPLAALEWRLGQPKIGSIASIRHAAGGRTLRRVDARTAAQESGDAGKRQPAGAGIDAATRQSASIELFARRKA